MNMIYSHEYSKNEKIKRDTCPEKNLDQLGFELKTF